MAGVTVSEPRVGSGLAGLHREWTAEPVSTGVSGAGAGRGTYLEGYGVVMCLRRVGVLGTRRTRHGLEGAGAESLRCAPEGGVGAEFGEEGAGGAESSLQSAGRGGIWIREECDGARGGFSGARAAVGPGVL